MYQKIKALGYFVLNTSTYLISGKNAVMELINYSIGLVPHTEYSCSFSSCWAGEGLYKAESGPVDK
jgi:hypothetical protein